jgi:uncharacterized membrane protein
VVRRLVVPSIKNRGSTVIGTLVEIVDLSQKLIGLVHFPHHHLPIAAGILLQPSWVGLGFLGILSTRQTCIVTVMDQGTIQEHIELIAKHEKDFLSRRTWDERMGDAVSSLVGSLTFVAIHAIVLVTWIGLNSGWISRINVFDPKPFPILDLCLAFESILLASFILMRQSRIARRTDERNHLELQLMLLTEKEVTANLGVCRDIAKRLGLNEVVADRQINQFSEGTSVDQIAESIREKLSND